MEFINGEIVGILLFFIGLYGLMTKKSIAKTIMSMSIMESGVFLFFITINYSTNSVPPIGQAQEASFADPVPSALMITAIVIGIGVTAIGLTMFMHYKQKHGITHWTRKRAQQGSDH
ncbi:sodium:proton antiporter [Marinilactibacillus sp. GCM10026970]|uniref:sodium:proton antiporter n=1 Tax=unclassified Marinilactibacillus TaxID=2632303 RepID=UPI001CE4688E|nr:MULTISPECIES: cation:proton antiporter subunit C [unclassified Marinilactibacillus]MEC6747224.1 cation:proton antiporter subunit C [Marinilactibacillus sp. XAAS-LB27]